MKSFFLFTVYGDHRVCDILLWSFLLNTSVHIILLFTTESIHSDETDKKIQEGAPFQTKVSIIQALFKFQ